MRTGINLIENILSEEQWWSEREMTDEQIDEVLVGTGLSHHTRSLSIYAKYGLSPRMKQWIDAVNFGPARDPNLYSKEDVLAAVLVAENRSRNGSDFVSVDANVRRGWINHDGHDEEGYVAPGMVQQIRMYLDHKEYAPNIKKWKEAIRRIDEFKANGLHGSMSAISKDVI